MTRDSYTGESEDPLSLHLYTYCENDGVNAWDPSGHKIYATEENIAGFSFYLDKYVQSTKNKSAIGKKKRNIEDIVTVKKLRKIGWKEQNIQYTKLVKALKKYKMKNKDSIAFFIATCSAETDCGNIMLEHGSEKYF